MCRNCRKGLTEVSTASGPLPRVKIEDVLVYICGYGGIGSFELDRRLWRMKGK